jgi:NAD(P)-dependent dehydrogenase (short-subunit alcohol dehydrogenase family)
MSTGLFDLSGRVAVVMGGTTGLGRAIALGLAEAGADVVASARRPEQVDGTAAEIEALGRRTLRVGCDVTQRPSVQVLHDGVMAAFGRVDILVNAAGITFKAPAADLAEEDWNRVMDTNLMGTLRACQIFGLTMVAAGYGRIVNIASLSTFVSFHEVAAYSASKAAVASLTRSLAVELAQEGRERKRDCSGNFSHAAECQAGAGNRARRRVADAHAYGRFGRAEEVAGAAVFLASEAASFVTGQVIAAVDGGFLASGVNQ